MMCGLDTTVGHTIVYFLISFFNFIEPTTLVNMHYFIGHHLFPPLCGLITNNVASITNLSYQFYCFYYMGIE